MSSIRNVAVSLVVLAACSHAQPAPAPTVAEVVAPPAPAPTPVAVAAPKPPPPEVAPASVYFDFDSSELALPTRALLQAFFDQSQQRPDQSIRIEGNCDERGSREYNLALGQRRADAAKKYLTDLGLDASRVTTVSYGEERPRSAGHDEAAWRENRRDDLIPGPGDAAPANTVSQAAR